MKRFLVGFLLGSAVLSGAVFGGTAAFASTTGTVHVWVDNTTTATSPIILTGAIGDHGKSISIDKNGKTDVNGNYVRIVLKKGSFEVNAVALGQAFSKLQPTFSSGCTGTFSGTAPVTVFNGTGAYAHISGTLNVTNESAFVLPTFKNGKCNDSEKASPVAQYSTITGSGTLTFG